MVMPVPVRASPRDQMPTGPYRIVQVRAMHELAPRLEDWEALAAAAEHGEWFAGPQWLLPLLRTYFGNQSLALQFVYAQDVLVGVVPLVRQESSGGGCTPPLSFPVNSHVRRIGVLSRIPEAELLTVVLGNVSGNTGRCCVGLPQVPQGSTLDLAIAASVRAVGLASFAQEQTRSAIAVVPDGWDAYVKTRTSKQLHPLRKRRKLERDGGWTTRLIESPADLASAWEALLHIERLSWKQAAHTSIANEPGANAFYGEVALRCAEAGMLRLYLLEHRGRPVAHVLSVVQGRTWYLLKHSFDEAHGQLSPGFLLVWHAMEQAARAGCTHLDLLGDAMAWKMDVATASPEYVSHLLFSRGNLPCQWCRFKETALKPLARKTGIKRLLLRVKRGDG